MCRLLSKNRFFFPDLGATMEPNEGGTNKTTTPKHQSWHSQGAAGRSARRPNSEGTFKLTTKELKSLGLSPSLNS